jgi:hypothetical protein
VQQPGDATHRPPPQSRRPVLQP